MNVHGMHELGAIRLFIIRMREHWLPVKEFRASRRRDTIPYELQRLIKYHVSTGNGHYLIGQGAIEISYLTLHLLPGLLFSFQALDRADQRRLNCLKTNCK